jgi:pimeloyl-ACP methyl ester carboxylesterase
MTIRLASLAGVVLWLGTACRSEGGAPPAATIDTVAAPDGIPMVYESRGRGEPALVFIHCWACDRTFWRGQIDSLAGDHLVVAVDLPGHGASGRGRADWSIPGLGADVAALVTALELPRVVLVGHSMGAPVALAAAARLRGRVAGIVCVDALHDAELRAEQRMIGPLLASFSRDYAGTMTAAVRGMFAGSPDTASANRVLERSLAADTGVALSLMRTYPSLDFVALLADAGAPVRCINAAPGPRAAMATKVESNRKYGDFDAVLMDGVGHYLHLERPGEFNARLREIVAGF